MGAAVLTYDQANKYSTEERTGFHIDHHITIDDIEERIIIKSKEGADGSRRN